MGHMRKTCISFLLTNRCNLRCRYCYFGPGNQRREAPQKLDPEFAARGLADFLDYLRELDLLKDRFHIRFFAEGEPTLELEIVRSIHQRAERLVNALNNGGQGETVRLFTEIQTNGCFGSEAAGWIAEHADMVWVSLDGPPEVQNYYRPFVRGAPTSGTVEKNIRILKNAGVGVGVRATVGRKNIDRLSQSVDYFEQLGADAVFADHMCETITAGRDSAPLNVPPLEYAQAFLQAWQYAITQKSLFFSNFLCVNFDEPCDAGCRAMIPAPHLTPRGLVTCCDMAVHESGPLRQLVYGKWEPRRRRIEYRRENIDLIRTRNAQRVCSGCPIKFHCCGGCMGEAVNETGDFYGVNTGLCEATRLLYEEMVGKRSHLFKQMLDGQGLFKHMHP